MFDKKITGLLALSTITSPFAIPVAAELKDLAQTIQASSSPKAAARRMEHQQAVTPSLQPMGTFVGELQEKWQFPSDHLPIGMSFENLHIASWNVLDANYMSWVIEKNSQGLSRSMIADEHVYIGDTGLTVRDQHVADLILEMISHPTHPRSMLSLQECSEPFLKELRSRLPSHFGILVSHGDAVIVDRTRIEVIEVSEISGVFADAPYRAFQELLLRRLDNGQSMRLINIHLPGDPTKPGRDEFARYLANTFDPDLTTLVMGDMNFNEIEMAKAMKEAFQNQSPFSIYSPYCTNISVFEFNSKAIDHFFVYSPGNSPVSISSAGQLMAGLDPFVSLLENGV